MAVRHHVSVTEALLSSGSVLGRAYEASHAEDQDRQVDEGLKRGGRAVDPVAQPAEALEPAEGALDHVALPLERGILSVQLTGRLLGRDAAPCRDERPKPLIVDKLPEAQAVVALVGQQGWLGRLGGVRQDVTQDRQRFEDVGQGEDPERRRRDSCPGPR